MLKEAVGTGDTVEEATAAAKAALNAPEEAEVKFEVVVFPQKKTLGFFGGSPAKVRAYYEEKAEAGTDIEEYIRTILTALGIEKPEISFREEEEGLFVEISCEEDYGIVIGRRGETLDAIQYLCRLVSGKSEKSYRRLSLNIGNYRLKREEALKLLAEKSARQVLKYGRKSVLEPMNPYERRIIHTVIQEMEGVSSHSVGEDDARRVVITSDSAPKSRGRQQSGDHSRGGGKAAYGNRSGGRPHRREAYSPPAADRAPRKDAADIPLYGAIPRDSE